MKKNQEEIEILYAADETVLLTRSLRSGQKVYAHGNLVIQGDVNPGAQVIATGSIIVIGTLRGSAHAGVTGNTLAYVMAWKCRPTQIAIGDKITRSPDALKTDDDKIYAEIAMIVDGQIVVEPYQTTKRKVVSF